MSKIILSLMLALIAVGCGPRYVDYFPCHDDGRPKPKVVIVPVAEVYTPDLPWDVSHELTNGMHYEVMQNGDLYLWTQEEVSQQLARTGQVNFFTNESALAQNFSGADFVVLTEFLEQNDAAESTPSNQRGPCREVEMKTRIKVVDIRGGRPRIIQQEIFTNTYIVAFDRDRRKASNSEVGPAAFQHSHMGQAHQQLVGDLVARIEKVIKGAC